MIFNQSGPGTTTAARPQVTPGGIGNQRSAAKRLVAAFAARAGAPAFTAFTNRAAIARSLELRIDNPSLIHQQQANLCGPAAFVFEMATRDPETYARFVIELYEQGRATIHRFVIEPSEALLRYALPPASASLTPPDPVDWIALASIRNARGSFVFWDTYDNVEDAASGITMPSHLTSWLQDVGYQHVSDETSTVGLVPGDAERSLTAALAAHGRGVRIFFLIHAALFNSSGLRRQKGKSFGTFPNHWVLLESGALTPSTLSLRVWTWGTTITINDRAGFLSHYFGYIAAQY